jgi:predicted dehydrogenase
MENTNKNNSRREFIKRSALLTGGLALSSLGLSAKSYRRVLGANDRINIALIGCNRRFYGVIGSFPDLEGIHISHVCDVNSKRQAKAVGKVNELLGYKPEANKDIRQILESRHVDAIMNMTPDHWHAPGAWMAMEAGKSVYLEKPCMHNPHEGEILLAYQKKYKGVVQAGNQQRSSSETQQLMKMIGEGVIGEAYMAQAFYSNNRGRVPDPIKTSAPEYLDWELFQGPAPRIDFLTIYDDYNWHWDWHFGTGETGNNAMHELDIARWALGVDVPDRVDTNGGKYHYKDDFWMMYDTLDATFHYGDKMIKWDGKSRNNMPTYGAGRGTIIYGTEGSAWVDREVYRLYDRDGNLTKEVMSSGNDQGTALGGEGNLTTNHIQNFINAIKGKEALNSPLIDGVKGTNLCLYANIAYRAGNASLNIDPATGKFKDAEAMKLWSRKYEPGWEPGL